MYEISAGDCLAGGGGVTRALGQIDGVKVKWVLNHDQKAIRTNMFNNKGIKHYFVDMYHQDEKEMEPVDFFFSSIECTEFSPANGGKEKKLGSYMLGWEMFRYVKYHIPYVIGIENVPQFKLWAPLRAAEDKLLSTENYSALLYVEGKIKYIPNIKKKGEEFKRWKNAICSLGYEYNEFICNAADFGFPTRRVRYFAFFTQIGLGMTINWPVPTHEKYGRFGRKKWVPCRDFINLANTGESIFGRAFNPNIKKGKRKPHCPNTLRRLAGGIKKNAPDLYFILHYYGSGTQFQSIDKPLNTISTRDRHALVTLEKVQFTQDYCRDIPSDEPVFTELQKKQLQFISDSTFSGETKNISLDETFNTITSQQRHQLVTSFISKQYNSNGKPELNNQGMDSPLGTLTTQEKFQFISTYFNCNGKQENESLDNPFGAILPGADKKALIAAIQNGEVDFDIKMRFLEPDELSRISTFPEKYFSHPLLKLSRKEQVALIGKAVPPQWAKIIIEPVILELQNILSNRKIAV